MKAGPHAAHLSGRAGSFRLTRRFALYSLLTIGTVSVVAALVLSRQVASRMLVREAQVQSEFVHGVINLHKGADFFSEDVEGTDRQAARERVFGEIARIPDVLHANLFDREGRVLWSPNARAIGKVADANESLRRALRGEIVVESDLLSRERKPYKPEHAYKPNPGARAVENYIPVRDEDGTVIGVVELYMSPDALLNDIALLGRQIWLVALGSGAFVFAALLGIVRRADATIRWQQHRLVETETFAALGEMASAVAHGVRNPLAGIRTTAELMAGDPRAREQADDIIQEVDRLERWIRRLLGYAHPVAPTLGRVTVPPLADLALERVARFCERSGIVVERRFLPGLPDALADAAALEVALSSVLSNAVEAMPEGGRLTVTAASEGDRIVLEVADTGVGIEPERLSRIFEPFGTTKTGGLGVGLALVQRTMLRMGGSVAIDSRPGAGTCVMLRLRPAPEERPQRSTATDGEPSVAGRATTSVT